MVVHPYPSLETPLLALDLFGLDVEDVGIQLVFALLAGVGDVVLGNFVGSQHKRHQPPDVLKILLGHCHFLQTGLRSKNHLLDAPALVVEQHVHYLLIFTIGRVAVERLHLHRLTIGVVVAGDFEFLFPGGEFLDDFLSGNAFGRRRIQRSFSAVLSERQSSECKANRCEQI